MKQSLQLRLGQQITMTPQLQQAIRLLQLSTLDLQLEVQQALESNIMLEIEELEQQDTEEEDTVDLSTLSEDDYRERVSDELDGQSTDTPLPDDLSRPEISNTDRDDPFNEYNAADSAEVNFQENETIPTELAVDSQWEDIYEGTLGQYDYPSGDNSDFADRDPFNQHTTEETLQEHLLWQLQLTPFSDTDRTIAHIIIDSIDGDGYLRTSLEDIADTLGEEVDLSEIEAVLHRIQHFDPIGVAARDLGECLVLQLSALPPSTPWRNEALTLAKTHLDVLAARDYAQLTKRMKLGREELREVVELIQSLRPRPGSHIEAHNATYVVPDVFVRKVKGQWKVELNAEIAPRLRVNQHYADLISRANKETDVASLKNHLQEARWFIKSLKSRHETLLKVARCIVKRQTAFLDYGEEAMKPLVLYDIASELEMHESTISRVTTQKYIHTPRGIFELKYFFSSHVSTNSGGECSSTAIRALIKKLIASESAAKPLSDSKIARLLSERGINVARRTVAKYREAMVIPPSNERKRLT
ncbi:RNA polymerase factor sigma-54 [Thioflexithrix psekupsensis]|uniref:RNA polymerase sigma-54 factor n=1 Tax=Thioflexithrix psekupsensis TaxID=1570016 RepID=A0A251X4V3_9GAMM|nr:RNA polymerase factor sigma-54 [Thioflexithrix psekupsensis]OUD12410.1 RNA polymerase factor sigma-54 [Thioflexithrix psekupsensis]